MPERRRMTVEFFNYASNAYRESPCSYGFGFGGDLSAYEALQIMHEHYNAGFTGEIFEYNYGEGTWGLRREHENQS